jgi:hypothetical protein
MVVRRSGNMSSLVGMRSGRFVRNALLIRVLVQKELSLEVGLEKGCLQHGVRRRNLVELTPQFRRRKCGKQMRLI